MSNKSSSSSGCGCAWFIPSLLTGMIGYAIHGSIFWAVMDFIFWPITILKWIIWHEVTLTIVKSAFSWFFQ